MLNIKANDVIENQPIIVRQINKKINQNNKEYYSLQISFGIKNFDAKIWSGDNKISEEIVPGCIAIIDANARDFKGNIQLHISRIERVYDPSEELIHEITPSCELLENDLRISITNMISTVKDEFLNKLLANIFISENIDNCFFKKAAGAEIHHAYIGGLAQHTMEVTNMVVNFCHIYPSINYDMAITAALLHDIGKTVELSDFPENKYTDTGRLIGHIAIGAEILNDHISKIDNFPYDLKNKIIHCILSHHGTQEAGSAIVPMTIEAIAVHNADKASAEINAFYLAIQRDAGTTGWTDYNNIYRRYIKK